MFLPGEKVWLLDYETGLKETKIISIKFSNNKYTIHVQDSPELFYCYHLDEEYAVHEHYQLDNYITHDKETALILSENSKSNILEYYQFKILELNKKIERYNNIMKHYGVDKQINSLEIK